MSDLASFSVLLYTSNRIKHLYVIVESDSCSPCVWLHPEHPVDFLSFFGGDRLLHVEDSLLPVRVGGLGGCGETDPLVTLGELDVEESHQSLE